MKVLTTLLLIIISYAAVAQEKDINFTEKKQDNKIVFSCTNNTNVTQEVTLILTKKKGLKGYSRPVMKKVAPKSTITFATFPIIGAYSYSYKSAWKEVPSKKEKNIIVNAKKEKTAKDVSEINKGIVIFDKTDCPRCQRSTAYLLDNNIDFKLLNITNNKENKNLMWDLLRAQGVTKTITTPVFLVDGKLSWSHKDLSGFLEGLKSR